MLTRFFGVLGDLHTRSTQSQSIMASMVAAPVDSHNSQTNQPAQPNRVQRQDLGAGTQEMVAARRVHVLTGPACCHRDQLCS